MPHNPEITTNQPTKLRTNVHTPMQYFIAYVTLQSRVCQNQLFSQLLSRGMNWFTEQSEQGLIPNHFLSCCW